MGAELPPSLRTYARADIRRLLGEVQQEGEFYVPLSIKDDDPEQDSLLRALAAADFIHWCPYPEEFYIITPEGKACLDEGAA